MKPNIPELPGLDFLEAIQAGDALALKNLLENGSDANQFIGEFLRPALEVCATSHIDTRYDLTEALLSHGANPNTHGKFSTLTTMHRVCMRSDSKMAMLILEKSKVPVDLMAEDSGQWTSAMFAAASNSDAQLLESIQAYFESRILPARLKLGVNHLWDHKDASGCNAAMIAADNPDVLRWIFNRKTKDHLGKTSDIEDKDFLGQTALWHACRLNCLESVQSLLGMGANANTFNHEGQALVDYCQSKSRSLNVNLSDFEKHNKSQIINCIKSAISYQSANNAIDELLKSNGIVFKNTI